MQIIELIPATVTKKCHFLSCSGFFRWLLHSVFVSLEKKPEDQPLEFFAKTHTDESSCIIYSDLGYFDHLKIPFEVVLRPWAYGSK